MNSEINMNSASDCTVHLKIVNSAILLHCSLALRGHFFFLLLLFSVLSFVFVNFFNIFFKKKN